MKQAILTTAVVAAALMFATNAGAHIPRPNCNNSLPPKAELACARVDAAHALGAVRWAQHERRLSSFGTSALRVALAAVIENHRWLYKTMVARIAEAKRREAAARLARPVGFPPHHSLWVCIGSFEGSPTSDNGYGHYGLLQMSYDWMNLIHGKASDYPQAVQEWAAETAWKENGYSWTFLNDQWFRYDNADGCYSPT